ncbi:MULTISPECIES: hypothetical protein [unclassified Pseudomonas]|uniref:hypothetical protein n=1 Tax=unclassified Pseudomonas TaxID=196821 RepID=UPI00131CBA57|nr:MULTISPECIES: hypothetical protein [unclassified Pseudomonas]
MYDPTATYDVLDPNTGEVLGRLKAGQYTDLHYGGVDKNAIDGSMDGTQLKSYEGKVIGHIDGDAFVQEHSGIAYPLRLQA